MRKLGRNPVEDSPTSLVNRYIDPHIVLNLKRDCATAEEIESSYRRLSILHHPNRHSRKWSQNGQNVDVVDVVDDEILINNTKFVLIAASYETLCHEETKQRYTILFHSLMSKVHRQRKSEQKSLLHSASCCHPFPNKRNDNGRHIINQMKNTGLSQNFCQEACVMHDSFFDYEDDDENYPLRISSSIFSEEDDAASTLGSFNNDHYDPHCGPLTLLYSARNQRPFTHPFLLFQNVFGNNMFTSSTDIKTLTPEAYTHIRLKKSKNHSIDTSFSAINILPFHSQSKTNTGRGYPFIPSTISSSPSLIEWSSNPHKSITEMNNTIQHIPSNSKKSNSISKRETINPATRIKRTETISRRPSGTYEKIVKVQRLEGEDIRYYIHNDDEIDFHQLPKKKLFPIFQCLCTQSFPWKDASE